eukprot:TRINITY_DN1763_c0_g1_i1.p1 TRINITY_DN1763_c0_g1~~TRINITY_DN1763_c0_g1_i1.p1  ORF type:complete len:643 (+),score=101.74 TRINITY_DN1763_c0_g1_i1:49-1977(+)
MIVVHAITILTLSATACVENMPGTEAGTGYTGCTSKTRSGKKCLPWAENREDGVFKGDRYCRNPGGRRRIWCRIKQKPGWEYCDPIVQCSNETDPCPVPDQCYWPVCHQSGKCTTEALPAGTFCDDGNSSTIHDVCNENGVCAGVDPCEGKVCTRINWCHEEGVCVNGYCTEPKLPNGTPCSTGIGMSDEHCQDGMCVGSVACGDEVYNSSACIIFDPDAECTDDGPIQIITHRESCTDSNPETIDTCSEDGICVSKCKGRKSGCGIKLSLNDGHCSGDDACEGDLVCAGEGSCARIWAFKASKWPKTNDYSWDTQDRCCVPNDHCSEVSCEGKCGDSSPFSPTCTCSCNANCKDKFDCCPDYEAKCFDHKFRTDCTCAAPDNESPTNCDLYSVQPCGCSCHLHTCVKEGNCCYDAAEICSQLNYPTYPAADCSCSTDQCAMGNDCGCICDIRCSRCQFEDADRNSEVCDRCCNVEDVCSFEEEPPPGFLPRNVEGCSCRGNDNKCVASWFAECGACACDHLCLIHGDCCKDKPFHCGGAQFLANCTCEGSCGDDLAPCLGCSCAPSCELDGTCCPDYTDFCNQKHVIIPLTPSERLSRRKKLVSRYNNNGYIYLASLAAIGFFFHFHRRTIIRKFFGKSNK